MFYKEILHHSWPASVINFVILISEVAEDVCGLANHFHVMFQEI